MARSHSLELVMPPEQYPLGGIAALKRGWSPDSEDGTVIQDVSSPIDLRLMADALEWESTALAKRPWRTEFFDHFASSITSAWTPVHRILELGSGPGFLAEHLLRSLPSVTYVALDFSGAMHQLAAKRLGPLASRVNFLERNFRDDSWPTELGPFECVVTNQAVHELRHKSYARALHAQVKRLLTPSGFYLVCDHFVGNGGMIYNQLFMTVEEQCAALQEAEFRKVEQLLCKGSLVLHLAM